jgi:hypothetical protein
MTRFKLLIVAAALLTTTLAARPAKSGDCFLIGVCRSCIPTHPTPTPPGQPCKYNPCTGEYICASTACVENCVPPS